MDILRAVLESVMFVSLVVLPAQFALVSDYATHLWDATWVAPTRATGEPRRLAADRKREAPAKAFLRARYARGWCGGPTNDAFPLASPPFSDYYAGYETADA